MYMKDKIVYAYLDLDVHIRCKFLTSCTIIDSKYNFFYVKFKSFSKYIAWQVKTK